MWMTTKWRSNAVMYITVPHNKVLFSILYFFNQPIRGSFWNCPHILNVLHTHFSVWNEIHGVSPILKQMNRELILFASESLYNEYFS